jgi:hypothetical protein
MFFALHAAFEEDYTDLWNSIDEYRREPTWQPTLSV